MAEAARLFVRQLGGTVTSTFRSIEEQTRLYREAQLGRNEYPVNKPGTSSHHTGLAFDWVHPKGSRSADQAAVGAAWKAMGGLWGASDPIHFEHPYAKEALRRGYVSPRWWQ